MPPNRNGVGGIMFSGADEIPIGNPHLFWKRVINLSRLGMIHPIISYIAIPIERVG